MGVIRDSSLQAAGVPVQMECTESSEQSSQTVTGSSLTFSMAQQRRPGYSSGFPWAPGQLPLSNLADRS